MEENVFMKLHVKLSLSIMLVLAFILALLIVSLNIFLDFSNFHGSEDFMTLVVMADGEVRKNVRHFDDKPDESDVDFESFRERDKLVRRPDFKPDLKPDEFGNPEEDFVSMLDIEPPEFRNEGEFSRNDLENDISHEKKRKLASIFPFRTSGPGFRNYCAARLDENGNFIEYASKLMDYDDDEQLQKLISVVFDLRVSKKHTYKTYGIKIAPKEYGWLVILLDREVDLLQERRFAIMSIALFAISLIITFAIAWLFSMWSINPVKEAFKKQKQFIADASHELKTPIAVIGANIDVLEQEYPDNKWLGYIKTENDRMGKLVKDLLYLAKNDAGRMNYNMLPFDLCDAVACSILPFESLAYEDGKKLEIDIPKNVIPVTGDETKIKQVVIILTDNAFKNSDKGALIKVSVGKEGRMCYVSVFNTGHGISEADLEKIFDRFYRVDTSRARVTGGYGLGLAIAKTIATGHRGKIEVESKENEYAKFTFYLPVDMI